MDSLIACILFQEIPINPFTWSIFFYHNSFDWSILKSSCIWSGPSLRFLWFCVFFVFKGNPFWLLYCLPITHCGVSRLKWVNWLSWGLTTHQPLWVILSPPEKGRREILFVCVCVEVLRPSQPNGVMFSAVSLPNQMFTGQGGCVEVLRPSQPNGVMSSAVSLPNHTFTGQA